MSPTLPDTNPGPLTLDRFTSPIGVLLLVTDRAGRLRALDFTDCEARTHKLLARQYGRVDLAKGPAPASIHAALGAYFGGDLNALSGVAYATGGTVFQRSAWDALTRIPPGQTRSYGAQAAEIGNPAAVRAVGLANGANPVGIVIPCHRVIGASGALTGYAGGIERKRWLLAHEGARLV